MKKKYLENEFLTKKKATKKVEKLFLSETAAAF
jgi:hypothetical protein